jgi:hypothetical protein
MGIIARFGERLTGTAEKAVWKAAGRLSETKPAKKLGQNIEAKKQELLESYKDAIEFTKNPNPPEIEIANTMSVLAPMQHCFGQAKIQASPLWNILLPKFMFPQVIKKSAIIHEMTHSTQPDTVARAFVGDFVRSNKTVDEGLEFAKNFFKAVPNFNMKHFKKVLETQGILKPSDPEYQRAVTLVEAFQSYKVMPKKLDSNYVNNMIAHAKDPIEAEAYKAQLDYLGAEINKKPTARKIKTGLKRTLEPLKPIIRKIKQAKAKTPQVEVKQVEPSIQVQ